MDKANANPLSVMDEIERDQIPKSRLGRLVPEIEWQRFRTAIEAQAEELARMRSKHAHVELLHEKAEKEAFDLKCELTQKDARITRLEGFLRDKRHSFKGGIGSPHIKAVDAVLNETDRQSLAAVKAEALREAAHALSSKGLQFTYTYIDWLAQRANDIERETKEGS